MDGEVFASAVPLPRRVNIADRRYFREALRTGAFAAGEYQVGRITQRASLNFGMPVRDEQGRPVAVVYAALDLGWLNRRAAELRLPPGSVLRLIDPQGVILVHFPDAERWIGHRHPEPERVRRMQAQGTGTARARGSDGVARLYAFTTLPDGASLCLGIPEAAAFAEVRRLLARSLAALGLVALLTLAAAWAGSELLVLRRVRALMRAIRRLAAGDLSVRTGIPEGRDELARLAAAFDGMAAALQAATEERERMHAELEAARERLLRMEVEKKRFCQGIVAAVTQNRFHLVEAAQIPEPSPPLLEISLESPEAYARVRHEIRRLADEAGLPPEQQDDLVLAAGEAITNAVKHAVGGRCRLYRDSESLVIRVSDRGHGIRLEDLPAVVLQPGYSTKVSLGMGYTLMLRLVDQVWLATGPEGTTVQLLKWRRPEAHRTEPLAAVLDRFAAEGCPV